MTATIYQFEDYTVDGQIKKLEELIDRRRAEWVKEAEEKALLDWQLDKLDNAYEWKSVHWYAYNSMIERLENGKV